jgi:hypothetical protein
MKRLFLILLLSLVYFMSSGQVNCKCDSSDISYIANLKENVESLFKTNEIEFVIWDGDGCYGNENYLRRRLIKDELNEYFNNGIIKSVTYYSKKSKDCLNILTFEIDKQVLFEIHLIKIGNKICEKLVTGKKKEFISSIEKNKERILKAQ